MRVLICGASGFIGRNIFEALSQRHDIELLGTCFGDRFSDDMRLVDIDLTKRENVTDITTDMDIVIHAAAVTAGSDALKADPTKYIADNILMNTHLAETAHLNKVPHFIFMSCTVMYQNSTRPLAENEYDLNLILPEYYMGARIKIIMEDLCFYYSGISDTKFTMLRPSSVYGPYDKFDLTRSHVFDGLIKKIAGAKDKGEIAINGSGEGTRDFVHVSDLVNFIELILDKPTHNRFEVFNVGSGQSISIKHLAEKIIKISGKNLAVFCDRTKPNLANRLNINIGKAKSLDWQPKIDLDSGIRQTMDWYLKNLGERNEG